MKQPELGQKIAELRKARGLTQEELVNQCNLSVRTLQRIESGDVSPRSYTQRIIFTALEYDIHGSNVKDSSTFEKATSALGKTIDFLVRDVLDLFNLKTDTMKKLSILTLTFILIGLGFNSILSKSNAQSFDDINDIINAKNTDYIRWFNNGEVDSLVGLYREDARILPWGSGHEFIRDFLEAEMNNRYVFKSLELESVSLSDTVAVEKGWFRVLHEDVGLITGMYISEWRYSNKEWLMVNDISRME